MGRRVSPRPLSGAILLIFLHISCTYSPRCTSIPRTGLNDPAGMVLSPDGRYLYISNANSTLNYCSGFISRMELGKTTYAQETVFPAGDETGMSFLAGIAFSQDGSLLFAANRESNELLVLGVGQDALTRISRIPVGQSPYALVYFSPAAQVLVTNLLSDDVSVIDAVGLREVARIPLSKGPQGRSRPAGIAVNPHTSYAYVTHELSSYVSVLDLVQQCEYNPMTPPSAAGPFFNDTGPASNPTMSSIALSPCAVQSEVWTATFTSGTEGGVYYAIEGNESGIQPNAAYEGVQYTSTTGGVSFTIFAGNPVSPTTPGDSFTFVTTRRGGVMTSFGNPSEYQTRGIAVFPDGTRAVAASRGLKGLEIADLGTNTFMDLITICDTPEGVAVHPDGKRIFATCLGSNAFYAADTVTHQVEDIVPTERGPSDILISPDGSRAYVINYQSRSIQILDLRTMTIVGRAP